MSLENAYVRTNRMYINSGPLNSSIVDSNNLPVSWVADSTLSVLLSQPGKAVFRDLGEYIDDPAPDHPYSSILRKIQLISNNNRGFGSTITKAEISTSRAYMSTYSGYIRMGNQPSTISSFYPSTIIRLI